MDSIRVFLLDDHEIVRTGLRSLLESEDDFVVVGEASTAAEALVRIPPTHPHVAILDVRLPDGSGIDVCRDIRSDQPEIACIMLTSYADDEALFAAVMAGASGLRPEAGGGSSLVDDVRRVAGGESLLDPALVERVVERLQDGPEEDPLLAGLTPQERRILDLVAEGQTNRQIADDHVPGREDREELRVEPPGQAGHGAADPGGQLRHPGGRAGRPRAAERRHRHLSTAGLPGGGWSGGTFGAGPGEGTWHHRGGGRTHVTFGPTRISLPAIEWVAAGAPGAGTGGCREVSIGHHPQQTGVTGRPV